MNVLKQEFIAAVEKIKETHFATFEYGYLTDAMSGHVVIKTETGMYLDFDFGVEHTGPGPVYAKIRMKSAEQQFRDYVNAVDGKLFTYEELLSIFD